MNQQLLPEPKHSVHTQQWLYTFQVTVSSIRGNIALLKVSFNAEMMLCSVEIKTQLHLVVDLETTKKNNK
jgi:hypothetical protein